MNYGDSIAKLFTDYEHEDNMNKSKKVLNYKGQRANGRVTNGRFIPDQSIMFGNPCRAAGTPEDPRSIGWIVGLDKPCVIGTLPPSVVSHDSGATSSHITPNYFLAPRSIDDLVAERFEAGNRKHEFSTTIYAEANWLKAARSRDLKFFRDRAGHALQHFKDEHRGKLDRDPGGNLGAVGWYLAVIAEVSKQDPEFYQVIQGVRSPDDYTGPAPSYAEGTV